MSAMGDADSAGGTAPVFAIVKVRCVPLQVPDDSPGASVVLDFNDVYQICGVEFPDHKLFSFRNAEDALNVVLKTKQYQLLPPSEHKTFISQHHASEMVQDSDGLCVAVFQRLQPPTISKNESFDLSCWTGDIEHVPTGARLVTITKWTRPDIITENCFVVSGLGTMGELTIENHVRNGITFQSFGEAQRYCDKRLIAGFSPVLAGQWKDVLNDKNKLLPLAHYSHERTVISVQLCHSVEPRMARELPFHLPHTT